jgi:hypothetical protein
MEWKKQPIHNVVILGLIVTMMAVSITVRSSDNALKIETSRYIQVSAPVSEPPTIVDIEPPDIVAEPEPVPVDIKPEFVPIGEIPLDAKLQEYIWNKCKDNDISFTLVLAIIKVESNFNPNSQSAIRNDGSRDQGLVQINSKYLSYESNRFHQNFDPLNPYDAIDYLVCRYIDERKYWSGDHNGDTLVKCIMGSYNCGRMGYVNKVKRSGYDYSYTNKILNTRDNMYELYKDLLPKP